MAIFRHTLEEPNERGLDVLVPEDALAKVLPLLLVTVAEVRDELIAENIPSEPIPEPVDIHKVRDRCRNHPPMLGHPTFGVKRPDNVGGRDVLPLVVVLPDLLVLPQRLFATTHARVGSLLVDQIREVRRDRLYGSEALDLLHKRVGRKGEVDGRPHHREILH